MLRVRGLSLRYPNGKLALTDFTLTVDAGELVVVLGGNGSGKTTLLRCVTRTLKPTAGEIWLGDTDLCALEGEKLRRARLELAMIWQHASLVGRSSVLTNVASGALGRHSTLRTSRGSAALGTRVGTWPSCRSRSRGFSRAAGRDLSGGQAQRVAIARALAQRPRVVLADEPVASLDPEAAKEIMRLLQRLARSERIAVLCVLHQVELAYAYADRVIGIRGGRLAFDLPRSEVSRETVHRLYLPEAA